MNMTRPEHSSDSILLSPEPMDASTFMEQIEFDNDSSEMFWTDQTTDLNENLNQMSLNEPWFSGP
jgi:hypothetical protein